MDRATAKRYREVVLGPGGSRDAAELVREFLGRPYDFDAFRRWLER
jgi:thimet oligopeptidase